ncbi:MAG: hypothetical protein U5J63_02580 [Fodinibius sp.]|nr:hypothetical protein [Fodinibius sp.]
MTLHQQDFLMRQIQHLTQILQQIIFKKNQNKQQEAVDEIQDAFQQLTRDHPKELHELSLEQTLTIFERRGKFQAELALAVADLLVEKANILENAFSQSQKSYAQALLLYRTARKDDDAAVPLDIEQSIQQLNEKLVHSDYITQINQLLE